MEAAGPDSVSNRSILRRVIQPKIALDQKITCVYFRRAAGGALGLRLIGIKAC